MTIHRDTTEAATGWAFHCDVCDHQFTSAHIKRADAVDAATLNGWIIATMTLCPGCAAAAGHNS